MSRIPTFKECAEVLENYGWCVKFEGYSMVKEYDTAVGPKIASIILQQSELYQSIWPSYVSEGRNILESHILFIKEKDNAITDDGNCEELKKILSNYSHIIDLVVDRSFGRELYLKHGFRASINAAAR